MHDNVKCRKCSHFYRFCLVWLEEIMSSSKTHSCKHSVNYLSWIKAVTQIKNIRKPNPVGFPYGKLQERYSIMHVVDLLCGPITFNEISILSTGLGQIAVTAFQKAFSSAPGCLKRWSVSNTILRAENKNNRGRRVRLIQLGDTVMCVNISISHFVTAF